MSPLLLATGYCYNPFTVIRERRKAVAFFIILCVCLVALAVALNVGWILLNLREVALLVLGVVFFALLITGLVLNTTFLVREIRRNEQQDAFLNAMTHELKTPIASLRLYLETLQTREVTPEKQKEFYGVMLADTDRLLQTVEQVLRAGRARDKRWRMEKTRLDVRVVALECLRLTRTRYNLDEAAVRYVDKLTDADAFILGHAEELRVAVMNLLDNAVKYSPTEVRVTLELSPLDATRLAIIVRDQGAGLPRVDLKRIFKRFYRASGRLVATVKGTGLGLFIVYSIVRRHNGRVFAESEGEGQGSVFTIQLPKADW